MAVVRKACTLGATLAHLSRLQICPRLLSTPALVPVTNYFKYGIYRTLKSAAGADISTSQRGLAEFFDDKKNWGEEQVSIGRAWKIDELRIKSNMDLHKLWYVLLKEKNMLLTMEHDAKEEYRLFPNPERRDKVEESMKHLEEVVAERNRAYWQLEIGETGDRPSGMVVNLLGQRMLQRYTEHFVPKWMHKNSSKRIHRGAAVVKFKKLMREQKFLEKRRHYRRMRGHVFGLWRRFPNMDVQALQKQYPEVDVSRLKHRKKARGNHNQNLG